MEPSVADILLTQSNLHGDSLFPGERAWVDQETGVLPLLWCFFSFFCKMHNFWFFWGKKREVGVFFFVGCHDQGGISWGCRGVVVGLSWVVVGLSWGCRGLAWVVVGLSWGCRGLSWGCRGVVVGCRGLSWGCRGVVVGLSWVVVGWVVVGLSAGKKPVWVIVGVSAGKKLVSERMATTLGEKNG